MSFVCSLYPVSLCVGVVLFGFRWFVLGPVSFGRLHLCVSYSRVLVADLPCHGFSIV